MTPPVSYAVSSDGTHIAWLQAGDGPLDVLYVPTWISQCEHLWAHPRVAHFFERMSSFARVIMFDRRGSGLSDPIAEDVTLEEQMDDVKAVMDAAGSERAALFAQMEGGPMAMLFAATHPERTTALVLYATFARTLHCDEMPWCRTAEDRAAGVDAFFTDWGSGSRVAAIAPSLAGDEPFQDWYARLERLSASPGNVRQLIDGVADVDVRDVLPSIRVPTLLLHRRDDPFIDPRHSEYLAPRIDGARLVWLPGNENLIVAGDSDAVVDEAEEFLTGVRPQREPDRVLATVMFTDIVDSTRRAGELGDSRWKDVLERHDELVRAQLRRHQGREIKTTGDGFLATFDGPARGIRCAVAIAAEVQPLGIEVRAGLHTGECELRGDDVAGMAVHIGARVGSTAGPSEVLVSSTVKDLVVGSGIEFADRGATELKGVPGEWRLFAVS
jgi:class 3 adenylate cyclase/alpha-beta hydrolase superfamily lysophospholipase